MIKAPISIFSSKGSEFLNNNIIDYNVSFIIIILQSHERFRFVGNGGMTSKGALQIDTFDKKAEILLFERGSLLFLKKRRYFWNKSRLRFRKKP